MLKDFYLIRKWNELTNREKKILFIGMLIGMMLATPLVMGKIPTPTQYTIITTENQVDYNDLYMKYCGETGNATVYDSAITLTPALDGNVYRNMGIVITSADVYLRAICFIDAENNVIEKIDSPQSGATYMIEQADDISAVIIFLYSITARYTIELWVW